MINKYHKNSLKLLIFNNALFNFSRTLPGAVIVIILLSHNISIKTFTLAKSLQLITSALLTIPAGIFADRYGRKNAILIACIAQIIYFSCLIQPTNISVIVGEIFNGIGLSFYIGAYEGWLLNLNKKNTEATFNNNILRSSEFVYLSIMIASLLGSIFSQYIIITTVLFLIISFIIFICIKEEKTNNYNKTNLIINASQYFFKNISGRMILICGSTSAALMQFIFQFWQPFFKSIGVKNDFDFGIIFSFTMLIQYLGVVLLRKYFFPKRNLITNIFFYWILSFISMAFIFSFSKITSLYLVLLLYALFNAFMTNASSLFSIYIAKSIPTKYHSTGISTVDFFAKLLGSLLFFMIIPIIKVENIKHTWFFMSFSFLIMSIAIYFLFKNKFIDNKIQNNSNEHL